jgi:hypothetical protein
LLEDGVVADLDVVGALDEALLADQVLRPRLVELLLLVGDLPLEDVQHPALLLPRGDLAHGTLADRTHPGTLNQYYYMLLGKGRIAVSESGLYLAVDTPSGRHSIIAHLGSWVGVRCDLDWLLII